MKRGSSGLSLVVAVDKPSGMSSHDVVNRCRRIFGERRVGHAGTLDPLATGVLPVCVGPATRLDRYLSSHDKSYRTTIAFGTETDTDDVLGEPTARGEVDPEIVSGDFAEPYVSGLVGTRMQVPPKYSAIKRNGKKAYEVARAGGNVELEPRQIEVYEAELVERFVEGETPCWVVDFSVSKGTYIRALARDIGRELGCYAHVAALERLTCGALALDDCSSLESIEALGESAAIDPVRLLGYRFTYADGFGKELGSGSRLEAAGLEMHEFGAAARDLRSCGCTGTVTQSSAPLEDGELISVIQDNRLKAIYRYDESGGWLKPDCVFSKGVYRG